MKIKIDKDPNAYVEQMFQETMKKYNYLKTDILLYLIYGENIKWRFIENEDTFYLRQGNDYLTELNHDEWRKMFCENSISIDKSRTYISILATEKIEKKFLDLLDELKIDYSIKHENAINKILRGQQFKLENEIGFDKE